MYVTPYSFTLGSASSGAVQIAHLRCERDILGVVDHPLVVKYKGSCQDAECVYLFLEYVAGGWVDTNHTRSQPLGSGSGTP